MPSRTVYLLVKIVDADARCVRLLRGARVSPPARGRSLVDRGAALALPGAGRIPIRFRSRASCAIPRRCSQTVPKDRRRRTWRCVYDLKEQGELQCSYRETPAALRAWSGELVCHHRRVPRRAGRCRTRSSSSWRSAPQRSSQSYVQFFLGCLGQSRGGRRPSPSKNRFTQPLLMPIESARPTSPSSWSSTATRPKLDRRLSSSSRSAARPRLTRRRSPFATTGLHAESPASSRCWATSRKRRCRSSRSPRSTRIRRSAHTPLR